MNVLMRKMKTAKRFYGQWGLKNTLRFSWSRLTGRPFMPVIKLSNSMLTVSNYVDKYFRDSQPLDILMVEDKKKRLNVVMDRIVMGYSWSHTDTALIIATEYARKNAMSLRIITRGEPATPRYYKTLLENNELEPFYDIEFFSDFDRTIEGKARYKLTVTEQDIFLVTSSKDAIALEKALPDAKYFYLIQRGKNFLYPYTDEDFFSFRIFQGENAVYLFSSKYLYDYYKKNIPSIAEKGTYFEPAFSRIKYRRERFEKSNVKYKLAFLINSDRVEDCCVYGWKYIALAIERGMINTGDWDIYYEGFELDNISFSNGYKPVNLKHLTRKKYIKYLQEMDVVISLSYRPYIETCIYEAACSGAVALTNTYLDKRGFPDSDNVILSDLEETSFMAAFKEAIDLAQNADRRERNYEMQTIPRDWKENLKDVLAYMKENTL